ncbi:PREDICTED: uncharacterized protein LOC109152693 [Ipomoea nil]|uniref:uncharacterized protein LOC109152693 n=1 Tax=Ipomoea nil TaxID=35883 RepID=UPI0009012E3E|nr:PREDICTED: uncharacterized protein LOC109152693 [Ipomoea nil]
MNLSGSECSSGCQSGWTTYFDQNSNSEDQFNSRFHGEDHRGGKMGFCSEDEDLSMVSDASSGPPHFRGGEEEEEYLYKGKQKRKSTEIWGDKQERCYLDDTASSPALSFPFKENTASMETNVPGVSEKHLKGKSVLGKHFGFLKSSKSGKAASLKSGGMKGRK